MFRLGKQAVTDFTHTTETTHRGRVYMPTTVAWGFHVKPWLLLPAARDRAREVVGQSDLAPIDRLTAAGMVGAQRPQHAYQHLLDRSDECTLVSSLDPAGCRDLIARGIIDEGMIPKIEACLDSLRDGVHKTHIIDGRLRHSLLLEIYTDRGVGTEIALS